MTNTVGTHAAARYIGVAPRRLARLFDTHYPELIELVEIDVKPKGRRDRRYPPSVVRRLEVAALLAKATPDPPRGKVPRTQVFPHAVRTVFGHPSMPLDDTWALWQWPDTLTYVDRPEDVIALLVQHAGGLVVPLGELYPVEGIDLQAVNPSTQTSWVDIYEEDR